MTVQQNQEPLSMVERVARAIDPLAWAIPEDDYPAEKARREVKQFTSLSQARRAIEAMRELNDVMKEAMTAAALDSEYGALRYEVPDEEIQRVFTAVIDAALKEQP